MASSVESVILPLLQKKGVYRLYQKNEDIYRMGEPVNKFMIITEGRAKLAVLSGGSKELLLYFTRKNDILGDLEYFSPGDSNLTVKAVTECSTLSMPMSDFRREADGNARLMEVMGQTLADKLKRSGNYSAANILYPLKERLAGYLYGLISGSSEDDLLGDSLKDISEMLGTSYRHLNRVITGLCEEGVLKRTKWGLTVTKRKKLKKMAGEMYL